MVVQIRTPPRSVTVTAIPIPHVFDVVDDLFGIYVSIPGYLRTIAYKDGRAYDDYVDQCDGFTLEFAADLSHLERLDLVAGIKSALERTAAVALTYG